MSLRDPGQKRADLRLSEGVPSMMSARGGGHNLPGMGVADHRQFSPSLGASFPPWGLLQGRSKGGYLSRGGTR